MLKYLIITLAIIFGALFFTNFFIGAQRIYKETMPELKAPHLYKNSEKNIDKIKIFVFYFVPKNKINRAIDNWHQILEEKLKKLQEFHSLQLQGRSGVLFEIYPKPVIGFKNSFDYDSSVTQYGNPHALMDVSEEIEKRVFSKDGDLFRNDFPTVASGAYPVLGIVYESVGAIGGIVKESSGRDIRGVAKELGFLESAVFNVEIKHVGGFFLLSRLFLTGEEYADFAATLFTHEFYHTLGIPDAYKNFPKDTPISQDIMGLGRQKPLDKTFISRSTLKELGL